MAIRETKRTEEERTFDYLNSRVHTRETSTLMFTTVAASASLLLLGILMGMENPINIPNLLSLYNAPADLQPVFENILCYYYITFQNSNDLLFVIGVLIIIFGIAYREATILSIDRGDYNFLRTRIASSERNRNGVPGVIRSIIVRTFFVIILATWFIYKYSPSWIPSEIKLVFPASWIIPICPAGYIMLIVGTIFYLVVFTTVEYCIRDC